MSFNSFLDGWTTNDLVFLWKEGDPVQVVKNLHLPRFTLEKFLTDYCNSKTNTGMFILFYFDLITLQRLCQFNFDFVEFNFGFSSSIKFLFVC